MCLSQTYEIQESKTVFMGYLNDLFGYWDYFGGYNSWYKAILIKKYLWEVVGFKKSFNILLNRAGFALH